MEDVVSSAKTEFAQAKELVSRALATTPDDRINWSPSATARSPLQEAAHAAMAIKGIQGVLDGQPFGFSSTAEADRAFREMERQVATRQQAEALLEENSAAFVRWLDALTPAKLDSVIELPFGLGKSPVRSAVGFAANHTRFHAAQMDYIQTIYGDQDWHLAPSPR